VIGARRNATATPSELDVESAVRDRLYGRRAEVTAMPIRRGTPTALGGRYRVLEKLGAGATADVYRARDERLRRDVAAKVIVDWLAHDSPSIRRFRREAELCARLAHPNVAAVLDAGHRPREYIVMELVDGRDAAMRLEEDEPLAPVEVVDVVAQICDALGHAHARGVLHCDVAPRNILIGQRGGTVKLVDFGAAVDARGAGAGVGVMGTPGYVAPEIIRGGGPSPQSDLYSLGVVAYRLLGGPPTAASRLPALADVRPELPRRLTALVDRAMAVRPAARPASAEEFRRGMLETQAEPGLRAA
jgi:serine/threonine protein kinase